MKVAPLMRALATRQGVRQTLVHSGQHYDQKMSDVFFRELEIPEPDFNLAVGSGTHAEQTGQIMLRFEPVVVGQKPDWVLVYGDVIRQSPLPWCAPNCKFALPMWKPACALSTVACRRRSTG